MKCVPVKQATPPRATGIACEIRRTMAATLTAADEFCADFQGLIDSRGSAPNLLSRADRFSAELLLREALTNAVLHGCRADAGKQIRCALRMKHRRLLIAVDDEGDGFDWRAAWQKPADLSACGGRGVEILRTYATRVRYNAKGNAVTIIKRFRDEGPL